MLFSPPDDFTRRALEARPGLDGQTARSVRTWARLFPAAALAALVLAGPHEVRASLVATGGDHTCAVSAAGAVKCWGANRYGQLGDGTTTNRLAPVAVSGLASGVVAVAVGGAHTCALTVGGAVQCWGANSPGRLGDGTTTSRLTPVAVSGLGSVAVAVAAGGAHTCALTAAGAVKCWGSNVAGQLGDGSTTDRSTPVQVSGLESGVVAVAAGLVHTCAVTAAGEARCWGFNRFGQLGDGTNNERLTPVPVSGLTSGVMAVHLGARHTCALTVGGAVRCWGSSLFGQVGDGGTTDRLTPVPVSGIEGGFVAVAVGWAHACARTAAGTVKCWGVNSVGQLGDGSTTNRSFPVWVNGPAGGVVAVTAGLGHTCARTATGAVKCWGWNNFGQVGDGSTSDRRTAVPVSGLTTGVIAVAAGGRHSCAVAAGGAAQCWGMNSSGQLGDGSTANRRTAAPVSGLTTGIVAVAVGAYHSCAVAAGGALTCWGSNLWGGLGDGTFASTRLTPVPVSTLASGVVAVAAGDGHTCALTAGGALKCWGHNNHGQLGDGSYTNRSTPVPVRSLASRVVAVAVGGEHTCALTVEGAVKCWGANRYGQLGDGTTTDRLTPVPVGTLASGVVAVAAGWAHTCAVMAGGAVQCWGMNYNGELGDGSRIQRLTPVPVNGSEGGFVAVAANSGHTCAVTADGAVWCWGGNDFGDLGDGSRITRLTPVLVRGAGSGGGRALVAGYR